MASPPRPRRARPPSQSRGCLSTATGNACSPRPAAAVCSLQAARRRKPATHTGTATQQQCKYCVAKPTAAHHTRVCCELPRTCSRTRPGSRRSTAGSALRALLAGACTRTCCHFEHRAAHGPDVRCHAVALLLDDLRGHPKGAALEGLGVRHLGGGGGGGGGARKASRTRQPASQSTAQASASMHVHTRTHTQAHTHGQAGK